MSQILTPPAGPSAPVPKDALGLALQFLRDMRASGSWDVPTLNRAIEFISGIK